MGVHACNSQWSFATYISHHVLILYVLDIEHILSAFVDHFEQIQDRLSIAKRVRGQTGFQLPRNVIIRANFLNRLKWTYVPAVLQLLETCYHTSLSPYRATLSEKVGQNS